MPDHRFADLPRLAVPALAAAGLLAALAVAQPAPLAADQTGSDKTGSGQTAELPPVDPQDNPYNMRDGKVDSGTYNGFRRYHASCHTCHGPNANGSTFAPALKESVQQMDYAGFLNVVVNGREVDDATGQRVMPGFATNPNVMNYIDDIWGYLKARADGALGPGRPERIR